MDHVKAAEKYVAGHEPGDVHPDVAAAMHRFSTAQDREDGDAAVQAHAQDLLDMVSSLGDGNVAPEPDSRLEQHLHRGAKKAAAKKAAARRSRS